MENNLLGDRLDDEISLVAAWNILMRSKWFVLGITAACVLAAAAYVYSQDKVYGSEVDVALAGTVPTERPNVTIYMTSPKILTKRLKGKQKLVGNDVVARVSGADIADPTGGLNDVMNIQVRGNSAEAARDFAATIGKELLENQNSMVDERMRQLKDYQEGLKADLDSVRELLAERGANLGQDAMQARAELLQASADLQTKIEDANRQMSSSYLKRAEIVTEPKLDENPVTPKIKLVLVAALFGGLMLALLFVAFREFLARAREQAE